MSTNETETPEDTRTELEIRIDLAQQMAAHMLANQDPAYRVTGRVWNKGGFVRVYTNVDSYAEIMATETEDGYEYTYRHNGRDRGSKQAMELAWAAAEIG